MLDGASTHLVRSSADRQLLNRQGRQERGGSSNEQVIFSIFYSFYATAFASDRPLIGHFLLIKRRDGMFRFLSDHGVGADGHFFRSGHWRQAGLRA